MRRKKGWSNYNSLQSKRHSNAKKYGNAGGLYASSKPAKRIKPISMSMEAEANISKKKQVQSPDWFNTLWDNNKGEFYRGTSNGEGSGVGFMGKGTYITWSEGMAKAFSKISSEQKGGTPKVETFMLDKDVKLADWKSKEVWEVRKELGTQNKWDKIDNPLYAELLTEKLKRKGYDGVISDDKAFGIVIFNQEKIKKK